jgi:hypothetical protein
MAAIVILLRRVARPVTISGDVGDDAKYQEKAVKAAIAEVTG